MLSLYYTFKTLPLLISALSMYLGYRFYFWGDWPSELEPGDENNKGSIAKCGTGPVFAVGGVIAMIVTVWKAVRLTFDDSAQEQDSVGELNPPAKALPMNRETRDIAGLFVRLKR